MSYIKLSKDSDKLLASNGTLLSTEEMGVYEVFAVYSETDNSLTFYYEMHKPDEGELFRGKRATNVYTGFENEDYASANEVPWHSVRESVMSVAVDKSFNAIKPISLAYWFTNMSSCESIDLGYLDSSDVISLKSTFYGCSSLQSTGVVYGLDLSNATTAYEMFASSGLTTLNIATMDTSKVTSMESMFSGCKSLKTVYSDDDVFVTTNVGYNYGNMFLNCQNLVGEYGSTVISATQDGLSYKEMARIDKPDSPGVFTSNPTKAFAVYSDSDNSFTFYANYPIPSAGDTYRGKAVTNVFTGFETETWDSTSDMQWYSLTSNVLEIAIDRTFKTIQPVSIAYWFYGMTRADSIEGLENIDTSKVTTMKESFRQCNALKNCDDMKGWDVSNVTSLYRTFYYLPNLENIDGLSEWNTSNVTSLYQTFYYCPGVESASALSHWDVSNATTLYWMLYGWGSLTSIDVSGWDTAKVTDMTSMFWGCTSLKTIYSNDDRFVTTAVTDGLSMFYDCPNLVGGNGTTYSSSNTTYSMAHVDAPGNPGYFTAKGD